MYLHVLPSAILYHIFPEVIFISVFNHEIREIYSPQKKAPYGTCTCITLMGHSVIYNLTEFIHIHVHVPRLLFWCH